VAVFLWQAHTVLDSLVLERSLTVTGSSWLGPGSTTRSGGRLGRGVGLRAARRRSRSMMLSGATSRRRRRDPGRRDGRQMGRARAGRRGRRPAVLASRCRGVPGGLRVVGRDRRRAALPASGQHLTIVADQLDYLATLKHIHTMLLLCTIVKSALVPPVVPV